MDITAPISCPKVVYSSISVSDLSPVFTTYSNRHIAQALGWLNDWHVDNPDIWKRSSVHHQDPHLDMHVVVQQDVAWLKVQVEQGWLDAVEEVHGQAGLMDDAELEGPEEAVGR